MLQDMRGSVHCNPSSQENLHFKASLDNKSNSLFNIHTNGLVATVNGKAERSVDAVRKISWTWSWIYIFLRIINFMGKKDVLFHTNGHASWINFGRATTPSDCVWEKVSFICVSHVSQQVCIILFIWGFWGRSSFYSPGWSRTYSVAQAGLEHIMYPRLVSVSLRSSHLSLPAIPGIICIMLEIRLHMLSRDWPLFKQVAYLGHEWVWRLSSIALSDGFLSLYKMSLAVLELRYVQQPLQVLLALTLLYYLHRHHTLGKYQAFSFIFSDLHICSVSSRKPQSSRPSSLVFIELSFLPYYIM